MKKQIKQVTNSNQEVFKKMVILSDLHCGHRSGLTPPEWQARHDDGFLGKLTKFQSELWEWYSKEIDAVKPIELLVVNGDAIDGKGQKSGGTELLTADRHEQVEMAKKCIELCDAKNILIISGTGYHVGNDEDWECVLASELGAKYANHEFVKFHGIGFDFKHKVNSSTVPHGRWTAPRRAALWNSLQTERGLQPNVRFLIRSHVHYYTMGDDGYKCSITTPALQGWSKFGSKECEGTNNIGFLSFEVENENHYKFKEHFFEMNNFKSEFVEFK